MRRKPTLFAVALGATALIAFSAVTLQPETAASGDGLVTNITPTQRYQQFLIGTQANIPENPDPSDTLVWEHVDQAFADKAAADAYLKALADAEEAARKAEEARQAAEAAQKARERQRAASTASTAQSPAPSYSGGSYGKWTPIVQCESGGNWAMNSGNGFYGGLQFHPGTWRSHGGGEYASTANLATPSQQIEIAEKVLSSQGWGAWPACSRKAGYR